MGERKGGGLLGLGMGGSEKHKWLCIGEREVFVSFGLVS